MERVGVLVVSYGAREAAIVDALVRSRNYEAKILVVDKQRNPFNVKRAYKHVVLPDLNVGKICRFAETYSKHIDFCIVGPEKPIIEGVRDLIEKTVNIPVICPTKQYAIEGSKIRQRMLFQEIAPEANPRFEIFNPGDYENKEKLEHAVFDWLDELENMAVVKPDKPAAGKGVGVWGDHFTNRKQLFEHFLSNYRHGSVIIEEKIEGEESSFQTFSDGKHLIPLPETRDYKRAFDHDKGVNTGGMGSYKNIDNILPFLTTADRAKEKEIVTKIFERLKTKDETALRGVPFYVAFMHTGKGPKILENNSRPGDPEIINLLPILKDDFIDICFKLLEGNLTRIEMEKSATVVTYKVPPTYGGYDTTFPELVNKNESRKPVDLTKAYKLNMKYGDDVRVYPGSMEQRDSQTFALRSRSVCVVGVGDNIEAARRISLEGINAIAGGALWHRTDIASKEHIKRSIEHMKKLKGKE